MEVREKPFSDTFRVSTVAATLQEIDKAYKNKDVYVRIGVARRLPEIVEEIKLQASKDHILPIIDALVSDDSPEVRETMMEQVLSMCAVFNSMGPEGHNIVSDYLLPFVISRLSDRNEETKQGAIHSLSSLCGLIERDTVVSKTLPTIEKLAHTKHNPKMRAAAIPLLNELALLIGKEFTLSFSLPLLRTLANDSSYVVRSALPANLNKICMVLGAQGSAQYILPIFTHLKEDRVWTVRRAVAKGLVAMSDSVDSESRKQLVQVFIDLSKDKVRWVRNEARFESGPFLVTFPAKHVVLGILDIYVSTASDENEDQVFIDPELTFRFAFNFPAVLLTVGKSGWPVLKAAYEEVAAHPNWEVRSSLAHSIHHVATILGSEILQETILPIVKEYCCDLDEVKSGILENLALLLKLLDRMSAPAYFDDNSEKTLNDSSNLWILDFIIDTGSQQHSMYWRCRQMIALQLSDFAIMYPPNVVQAKLIPLDLLTDKVAEVRRSMGDEAGRFIQALTAIFGSSNPFTAYCLSLAEMTQNNPQLHTAPWHCRVTYAIMCVEVFKHIERDKWNREFQPSLVKLLDDKVVNVRFNAGRSLISINKILRDNNILMLVKRKLGRERDRDIQELLKPYT